MPVQSMCKNIIGSGQIYILRKMIKKNPFVKIVYNFLVKRWKTWFSCVLYHDSIPCQSYPEGPCGHVYKL